MTGPAPQPCVCGGVGVERCRDCFAWLCSAHKGSGNWAPRCDECREVAVRSFGWWAFPLYSLCTLVLAGYALYVYERDGHVPWLLEVWIPLYAWMAYRTWRYRTGRAFRKTAPRARVVSRR